MAGGIVWFSLASLALPLALSGPVQAAGWTVPAVLLARCCVVRRGAAPLLPPTLPCFRQSTRF